MNEAVRNYFRKLGRKGGKSKSAAKRSAAKRNIEIGGESGKDRRDCGVDAIVDVANQCVVAGIPPFVKQDCSLRPGQQGRIPGPIWHLKEFPK